MTVNIAAAFFVLAFVAVGLGVLLMSVPWGLVVIGLMLAGAGVGLIETGGEQ